MVAWAVRNSAFVALVIFVLSGGAFGGEVLRTYPIQPAPQTQIQLISPASFRAGQVQQLVIRGSNLLRANLLRGSAGAVLVVLLSACGQSSTTATTNNAQTQNVKGVATPSQISVVTAK